MWKKAFALAALLLARRAGAGVLYVDAAALGPAHDGTSWATAFTDLQAALAGAGVSDEVWVAAGTYKPTATTDRAISFALKAGVAIYGGFAGTETLRSERDSANRVTILSGDIGTPGVATDNSYHVVTALSPVDSSTILDGFTITGGRADGPAAAGQDMRGGGLYVSGANPTFAKVIIIANYAANRGGGVRVESGGASFSSCRFESNFTNGGLALGVSFGGGAISAGSVAAGLKIDRCVFKGNGSGESTSGGAIHATNATTITNSLFFQNLPNAIVFVQSGNSILNCTITGSSGYGLSFFGGASNTIGNSILFGNATGQIFLGFSSGVSVSYCDVQGGGFGPGPGNLDANPLFENAAGGDYRLGSGSPAIDAGSNSLQPFTTDLAGLPRFFDDPLVADTGAGTAPIVDMGAYERLPLTVSNPASQSVCAGAVVSLSVTASGQPTLSYRWRNGGSDLFDAPPISGAATDTLTIDPSGTGNSGSYDVRVTDGLGQTRTSGAATVTVNPVPAAPVLTAPKSVVIGAAGVAASVPSHAGSAYAWTLTGGSITSGQGSNQILFSAGSPGTTMNLSVVETGTGGCVSPQSAWKVQVDFADVPPSYLFHNAVIAVARNGITTGCGGGNYCPAQLVTRDQMAVFILRGEHGGAFNPPAATGNVFSDVFTSTPFAKWMELLKNEGISTGCAGGSPPPYCPTQNVTRDAMAKFLLLGKHGSTFNPAAATGSVFGDVGVSTLLAKWIERLKVEGITSGCAAGVPLPFYCPTGTVTRGEMAKFITNAFGLQ
jgi:predicted outer membrane repeat protein